jgi:hypothetical protein
MDRKTALRVFVALEQARENDTPPPDGWDPPTYDVRLDASSDERATGDQTRDFRIRVTPGKITGGIGEDAWRYVLDLAKSEELDVDIQNSGMELR